MRIQLVILILLGTLNSCSKSPKCWGEDKNKGIIESSAQIDCEPFLKGTEFIINNDSTFEQLFTDSTTGELICQLPNIDFDKNSLLGLMVSGQCETKFIREVTLKDGEHKYHYKVIVKSCGKCKSEGYSYNWVIVPKIPQGWTITFETEEK